VIWTIQTDLEKLFEKVTSSIWTWDSLKHSQKLAKSGISIAEWHDIKIDTNSEESKKIDYKFGNWIIEWWIFYHENKNIDYANLTSYWFSFAWKIWNRKDLFWEFWVWAKLSYNAFEWQNWNKREYNVFWTNLQYSNQLFSNKTTNFWIWAVSQKQIMQDIKNYKEDWDWWIEDSTSNFWISSYINHKITPKLKWNINFRYWWDIWTKNIRTWIESWDKLFEKKSLGVWLQYTKSNWNIISWKVKYQNWLWYYKESGDISLESWNITLSAWYEETDNSKNPFLLDQAKKYIWLKYNISDTLNINFWHENTNNWSSKDDKTSASLKVEF
jgi:hypothetical protein